VAQVPAATGCLVGDEAAAARDELRAAARGLLGGSVIEPASPDQRGQGQPG
jgi:hypothetical protein